MGKIKVNVASVVSSGNCANSAKAIVNSSKNRINSIHYSIDGRIRSADNIDGRINNIVNSLNQAESQISRLKGVVDTCVNSYRAVDDRVRQMAQETAKFYIPSSSDSSKSFLKDKNKLLKLLRRYSTPAVGPAFSLFKYLDKKGWDNFWNGEMIWTKEGSFFSDSKDTDNFFKFLTGAVTGSLIPEYGKHEDDNGFGKFIEEKTGKKLNIEQQKTDKKQKNKNEKFYEKKTTILETKAEGKIEGSVIDAKKSGDNGWAEGSMEGKVLTGEAHAEAAAGLYRFTKDKNGKTVKVLSPSVSAEVGASVAVAEIAAEGRIGLGGDKKMLGAYGNVNAEVLSAEAKAGVHVIPGKQYYAGASAEANLAKVEGAAGVSVLGTDVGVTGALKAGVGVHANAGYTDGKIKLDVGAAVGVGFDLGFEVDVSGTVDAVTGFATKAWDGISSAFNWF